MITDMFISRAEEDYMGITEQETSNHRNKYNLLKSDGFEEAQQAGKRDRSATIT
jgi:flagellar biosynthesis/type III secretory pathway protein FliH